LAIPVDLAMAFWPVIILFFMLLHSSILKMLNISNKPLCLGREFKLKDNETGYGELDVALVFCPTPRMPV
jgi:hypothetical protein